MIWIMCDIILQERLCEESTIIERKKKLKENFTHFHFFNMILIDVTFILKYTSDVFRVMH